MGVGVAIATGADAPSVTSVVAFSATGVEADDGDKTNRCAATTPSTTIKVITAIMAKMPTHKMDFFV